MNNSRTPTELGVPSLTRPHRPIQIAALSLVLAVASGCGLQQVRSQAQTVESTGQIVGTVTTPAGMRGDTVVVVLRKSEGLDFLVQSATFASTDGRFNFSIPPGEYYVASFRDLNADSRYQEGEPGKFHGEPTAISLPANGRVEISIDVPAGTEPLLAGKADIAEVKAIVRNIGRVTTLEDERFSRENASLGLWRPLEFLAGPEGGLFMLQEYDARRMPVIFVHGMGGTPLDFSAAIEALDRSKYQPWVLYYPSGLRLDMVSDYLVTAVRGLEKRYAERPFVVVAHSMGGLVTRSFVQKYAARHADAASALRMVVTVNSPLGGMPSAASGVAHSPIVVPAWNDVATGSEFVTSLATDPWPAGLPWHLVFSYAGGDSDDGTVSLDSQIPLGLQRQATRLHGFKGTHTGTLGDPAFLALLDKLLAEAVARQD